MSNIADRVRTAQDKDGMLRRALERIIQLYTDKSHFVYELLQNAEDAEATSIRFVQYPDRLEVFHDGRPFTTANLQGLCDIGKSDKADNLNQIGEFGVGFKSVFGICDTVRLYSEPSHFRERVQDDVHPFAVRILDFTRPEDIPEEELSAAYTTRFVFPYTVGKSFSGFGSVEALNATLSKKLQNLGITTLLFMKNLELIEYQIELGEDTIKGEYLLDKTVINDHCIKVTALGTSDENKAGDSEELLSYLKFSRKIEKYPQRTVDIAFPVRIGNDGTYQCIKPRSPFVSVYFPTETESKLDFIVQGPYRTTPNRSSIPADDEDNILLAKETAQLLRDSILELKFSGILNMSFVKALPLSEERFETFGLFMPLFETVRELFRSSEIIPSRSGRFVYAKYAKIARQEKLATVLTDDLLTQLINDGHQYAWLPTFLTETNREYKHVLEYMSGELNIPTIRPEDLRQFISNNSVFLPEQSDDWLVELYGIFESIPAAFSRTRTETNLTTCEIVKTMTGEFAAPFRKEGRTYIPNVFLYTGKLYSDINIVDQNLYERCRHFFDDILQLQKPNEYEFLIRDIKRRYEDENVAADDQHIEDIRSLLKYVRYEDYREEVSKIINETLLLRCNDGKMRSTHAVRIFLPVSPDGLNIEMYYRNVSKTVYFVDLDFYQLHDIDPEDLIRLGVGDSLLVGYSTTSGTYDTGARGRQPEWWTTGEFRWKLSADLLKDVLKYISAHPTASDAMMKSNAIMKLLTLNEEKLCGHVHISGSIVSDLENEPCELIHILRGERMTGWDGKWLFTDSGDLVSPKMVSKHDISKDIYGRIKPDSIIFSLLDFKKTEADEVDDLKRTIPQEKLEAYFENELKQRYGISTADLNERYGADPQIDTDEEEARLPFPEHKVKSWDALRKHAAEMLIYADPVRYEERIRSIRVSNRPREAKAYLSNMYRHEGNNRFKFACQLCHDTCSSFETTEIFLNPETELDPVNLCLCPNCAAEYRRFRSDGEKMKELRNAFLSMNESAVEGKEHVDIAIDDDNILWFTQTHFAEIKELLKLEEEVKNKVTVQPATVTKDDEAEKSGMSVYSGYIGKILRRKDGFEGKVIGVEKDLLVVHVIKGEKAGANTKFNLKFILQNKNKFSFSDE